MSKKRKRLEKLRKNPKNVSFKELKQALEDYGFEMRPSSGTSHHFFKAEIGDKVWKFSVPFKKPHINEIYVKKAVQAIDEIIRVQPESEEPDE